MAPLPRYPVYQIDFTAVAAGKRVAATKRRIRWRFGFPNLKALEEGRTGTDCRGEEHEIVVVWSVTSGKREVFMDSKAIHYSNSRTSLLDYTWNTRGNHVLKVICHAAPPMSSTPGFRQYDLFIDGQSFFTMPKVYELGIRGAGGPSQDRIPGYAGERYTERSLPPSSGGGGIRAPRSETEEQEELQRAIRESLAESQRHLQNKSGTTGGGGGSGNNSAAAPPPVSEVSVESVHQGDLLDFGSSYGEYTSNGNANRDYYNGSGNDSYYTAPPGVTNYSNPAKPPVPALPPSQPPYASGPSYSNNQGPPNSAPGSQYNPNAPSSYLALPPSTSAGNGYAQNQQHQSAPLRSSMTGSATASQYNPTPSYPPQQQHNPYAPSSSFTAGPAPGAYNAFSLNGVDYNDPFAPKPPTRDDITNDILKAYSVPSPSQNSQQDNQNSFDAANAPQSGSDNQQFANGGVSVNALKDEEEEKLDPVAAALKKLVNIDHIDEPAEEQIKLTLKKEEDKVKSSQKNKSRGLPPAAQKVVGSGATLAQISQIKPKSELKPVMKNIVSEAAMAGALVVFDPTAGPPPLQSREPGQVGRGFGVGAGFGAGYNAGHNNIYNGGPPPPQQYPQQQPQYGGGPPPPPQYGAPPPPPQQYYAPPPPQYGVPPPHYHQQPQGYSQPQY